MEGGVFGNDTPVDFAAQAAARHSLGGLRRKRERVVEGIERAAALDDQLEALPVARVLDLDGHGVFTRIPKKQNVDTVALTGRQLAASPS